MSSAKKAPLGAGDEWTWTAIEADSKLVVSWLIGEYDADYANMFMADVADRLANRVQPTSYGHGAYLDAVKGAFGNDIDFVTLIKICGQAPAAEKRYSPPVCTGTRKEN